MRLRLRHQRLHSYLSINVTNSLAGKGAFSYMGVGGLVEWE